MLIEFIKNCTYLALANMSVCVIPVNVYKYWNCVMVNPKYPSAVGHGSGAVRTSALNQENPALVDSFIPRCLSSLSCINEYLATDRGGYIEYPCTTILGWYDPEATQGTRRHAIFPSMCNQPS